MFYWAIVHHDDGSAYGVSFPDVPDCFAAADEEEGVMAAAIDALDDYFSEAGNLPQASALHDVRQALAEDLAEGAYLIQVPLVRRSTKSVRANISLEQGLLEAIDEAARRANLNRSAFIAQAVRREILGKHAA